MGDKSSCLDMAPFLPATAYMKSPGNTQLLVNSCYGHVNVSPTTVKWHEEAGAGLPSHRPLATSAVLPFLFSLLCLCAPAVWGAVQHLYIISRSDSAHHWWKWDWRDGKGSRPKWPLHTPVGSEAVRSSYPPVNSQSFPIQPSNADKFLRARFICPGIWGSEGVWAIDRHTGSWLTLQYHILPFFLFFFNDVFMAGCDI